MNKNNFIYRVRRRVLPLTLATSLAFSSPAKGIEEKIELPNRYSLVKDNRTGEPVEFEISYSGENFNVNMIETDKRGHGKWRPWLIQGSTGRGRDAISYIIGRNNDNLSRFYGMHENEFYARLAMVATVAYFDDAIVNWPSILRDRAQEFRTTADGNVYFNASREVFDISGIAGGILLSKAVLKSNPGAVVLAGKAIKSKIMDHFMNRSTSPRNPKEFIRTIDNIADFIKERVITENTTRLREYADNLDDCATILDNHDLNPRTVQPGWDYQSAKTLYERLSVALPEGEALNSFLKELRGKETKIDALATRLVEKVFEGIAGITYADVINVAESVVEIFERQPDIKRGLDKATRIARQNKKDFLIHFESRFDITPKRRTDANTFLNATWPEYEEYLPGEIGEEDQQIIAQDETQEIKGAFPPPKVPQSTKQTGNLESLVEQEPQIRRAQLEPESERKVTVFRYEPETLVAGTKGDFYLYVRNDNDFALDDLDVHINREYPEVLGSQTDKFGGLSLEKSVPTSSNRAGWTGSGSGLITEPIMLDSNNEGRLRLKYRVADNAILGRYIVEYMLSFKVDGSLQQTKNRDDIEIEVVEESK